MVGSDVYFTTFHSTFQTFALTFTGCLTCHPEALRPLGDGGALVFAAQVWKRRAAARRSEASRERPERGADGSGGPRRSGRNSLKTHVGGSLLETKTKSRLFFCVDLTLSMVTMVTTMVPAGFVVLFFHLTFLKTWFKDVRCSRQRRPFSRPLALHPLLSTSSSPQRSSRLHQSQSTGSGPRIPHPGLRAPPTEEERNR